MTPHRNDEIPHRRRQLSGYLDRDTLTWLASSGRMYVTLLIDIALQIVADIPSSAVEPPQLWQPGRLPGTRIHPQNRPASGRTFRHDCDHEPTVELPYL